MILDRKAQLKGNIHKSYLGYAALDTREAWHEGKKPSHEDFVNQLWGRDIAEGEFLNPGIEHMEDIDKDLSIYAAYEGKDFHSVQEDLVYINPMLLFGRENNPFQAEKRFYPIDFGHQTQQDYSFTLKFSKDEYSIESLPESISTKTEKEGLKYLYDVEAEEGQIRINTSFRIRQTNFSKEKYPELKELFEQMRLKEGQRIVLRKM